MNDERSDKTDSPDFWKKIEIFSRPISALLTALAIGGLGYWGNHAITTMTESQQDTRLYTELMARREESESGLRKDMFTTILKDFFSSSKELPPHQQIDNRLLKLELLAHNFAESLSLSPLFTQLDRDMDTLISYKKLPGIEADALHDAHKSRLRSLARLVAQRQIAAIASHEGEAIEIAIPMQEIAKRKNRYEWPRDHILTSYPELDVKDADIFAALMETTGCKTLKGITRRIGFTFSRPDSEQRIIHVTLNIRTQRPVKDQKIPADFCDPQMDKSSALASKTENHKPIDFTLDFYNFPLIDNTLLSDDQRLAVVLTKFGPANMGQTDEDTKPETNLITVKALLFPGRYASRRDKPSLDDAIHQLRKDTFSSVKYR